MAITHPAAQPANTALTHLSAQPAATAFTHPTQLVFYFLKCSYSDLPIKGDVSIGAPMAVDSEADKIGLHGSSSKSIVD
jgi:hypothetical protein